MQEKGCNLKPIQVLLFEKVGDIIALDQAMEELNAQAETDAAKLETLTEQLAQAEADIADRQAALEAAQAQAEAEEAAYQEAVTAYETQLAEAEAQKAALETIQAEYEESLAQAEAELQSQKEALDEAEAYKLDRAPDAGEAHLATEVDSDIRVAADGVTAACQYTNTDASGNTVTVALVVDGETVYTRTLKPGESIDGITLEKPLSAGNYEAMVVSTVKDAAGETVMTTRVPVTMSVAAE